MNLLKYIIPILLVALAGCSGASRSSAEEVTDEESPSAAAPKSSPDSLYRFVAEQVAFGPRVPGSDAHRACADYIVAKLRSFGADTIIEQLSSAKIYTGETMPIRNILARFNPKATNRILLLAHYDTRPWADEDPDPANHSKPLDGANDGASGVAVLLETARLLGGDSAAQGEQGAEGGQRTDSAPAVGIDLLFVDLEDSGSSGSDDSWCLGTQEFTASLTDFYPEAFPQYAILLDMVGGQGATFPREYISHQLAKSSTDRVYATAAATGMSDRFPNRIGGSIIDDHLYINRAGIPCVDIIESANPATGSFPPSWHTLSDNLSSIDSQTLSSVANLILILMHNS